MVIELFRKIRYNILRVSIFDTEMPNREADLTVVDASGKKALIELKAYRNDQSITIRELNQLHKYMAKNEIQNGLLITTSNIANCNLPNVQIIKGAELMELLRKYGMSNRIEDIIWIQNERVNLFKRIKDKEIKRNKIIQFIQNYNGIPTKYEIEKNMCLDLRTYFKTDCMTELIKEIKKKSNTYNDLLCKDRQLVLRDSQPVYGLA
ncbi:MAG: restriction endonuclease [archaeon]